MSRVLILLLASALLSGCLSGDGGSAAGAEAQDGAGDAVGGDRPAADGSQATSLVPQGAERVTLLDTEFTIGTDGRDGSFAVEVPAGTVAVALTLDYQTGVFQDASFTLGECAGVSPIGGVAAMAAGTYLGVGSYSSHATFQCGAVPAGGQALSWHVGEGFLQGHVMVYADVAAEAAPCDGPDMSNRGLKVNGHYVEGGQVWRETNGIANLQTAATCAGPADTRVA